LIPLFRAHPHPAQVVLKPLFLKRSDTRLSIAFPAIDSGGKIWAAPKNSTNHQKSWIKPQKIQPQKKGNKIS
jgi:hypothetical protein